MNEKTENRIKELKQVLNSNKLVKTVFFVGVGVLSLYALSKVFSVLASTVKGFNELKSAVNGK
jgi:hypothetical protein